jgi:hypothetical protein
MRFIPDADFPFLHRLQHGGLRFWRSAIDFVGQKYLCEDRSAREDESAMASGGVFFENFSASNVRWHEVWRKLNAGETQFNRTGERMDEQSFCQARHTNEQTMAAAKKSIERGGNYFFLADDDLANFVLE